MKPLFSLSVMGEKKRAEIAFNVTEKMLQGRPSLLEKLKIEQQKMQELPEDTNKKSEDRFMLSEGENNQLKGVSNLVTSTVAPGKGSFLVAKNEIRSGQNLIVENPVASVALPKFFGTNCHHCMSKVEAGIGCSTCCGVAFCSLACKNEAKYHRMECEHMDLIIGEDSINYEIQPS